MENTSQTLEEAIQESRKRLKDRGLLMSEEESKEIFKSRGLVSFTPINSGKRQEGNKAQSKE